MYSYIFVTNKVNKTSTCSLGDGGNDVSMIQAADAGVGIEGKVRNETIEPLVWGWWIFPSGKSVEIACSLAFVVSFSNMTSTQLYSQ